MKRAVVTTKLIVRADGLKVAEVTDKYALNRCDNDTWNPNVTIDANPNPNSQNFIIECDDVIFAAIQADTDIVIVPATEETI